MAAANFRQIASSSPKSYELLLVLLTKASAGCQSSSMGVSMCAHIHAYVCVHLCACTCVCTHVWIHVCVCVHVQWYEWIMEDNFVPTVPSIHLHLS